MAMSGLFGTAASLAKKSIHTLAEGVVSTARVIDDHSPIKMGSLVNTVSYYAGTAWQLLPTESNTIATLKDSIESKNESAIARTLRTYPYLPIRAITAENRGIENPDADYSSCLAFAFSQRDKTAFKTMLADEVSMRHCLLAPKSAVPDEKARQKIIELIITYRPNLLLSIDDFPTSTGRTRKLSVFEYIFLMAIGNQDVFLLGNTLRAYSTYLALENVDSSSPHYQSYKGAKGVRNNDFVLDEKMRHRLAQIFNRYKSDSSVSALCTGYSSNFPLPVGESKKYQSLNTLLSANRVNGASSAPTIATASSSPSVTAPVTTSSTSDSMSNPGLTLPRATQSSSLAARAAAIEPPQTSSFGIGNTTLQPEQKDNLTAFKITASNWYTTHLRRRVWGFISKKFEENQNGNVSAEELYKAAQSIKAQREGKDSKDSTHALAEKLSRHRRWSLYSWIAMCFGFKRGLSTLEEILLLLVSLESYKQNPSPDRLQPQILDKPQSGERPVKLHADFQESACLAYLKSRGTVWFSKGNTHNETSKAWLIANSKPEVLIEAVKLLKGNADLGAVTSNNQAAHNLAKQLNAHRRWTLWPTAWRGRSACAEALIEVSNRREFEPLRG